MMSITPKINREKKSLAKTPQRTSALRESGWVWIAGMTLMVSACSTSQVRFDSDPVAAEMSLIRPGESPISLGKTPLNIKSAEHPEVFMNNAQIEFTKDGYTPELLIIPSNNLGPNSKLSIHLKELKIAQTCQLQDNQLNDIAQGVAESQKLLMKKEYTEGQNLLKTLITRFTGIPTLYILLANTYYLQKDYKQALDYYKKAQFIQPENRIVSRMVEKLSDFDTATRPERAKGAN